MHAHEIRVENGRIELDEPTDLPDGAELEVVVIDDELSPEERAELHATFDRALDDSEAGRGMDAREYLEQWEHRDEKELFVEEFAKLLEQVCAVNSRTRRRAS